MICTQVQRASGAVTVSPALISPVQRRSAPCVGVGCADGVAVAGGAVERRIFAVGFYLLGEDVAQSLPDVDDRCRARTFFLGRFDRLRFGGLARR